MGTIVNTIVNLVFWLIKPFQTPIIFVDVLDDKGNFVCCTKATQRRGKTYEKNI